MWLQMVCTKDHSELASHRCSTGRCGMSSCPMQFHIHGEWCQSATTGLGFPNHMTQILKVWCEICSVCSVCHKIPLKVSIFNQQNSSWHICFGIFIDDDLLRYDHPDWSCQTSDRIPCRRAEVWKHPCTTWNHGPNLPCCFCCNSRPAWQSRYKAVCNQHIFMQHV